jgi:ubiquitin-conjugating enzyme E2 variant
MQLKVEKKPDNRNDKLELLKSGYTPAKRRFEICTMTLFTILWIWSAFNINQQQGFSSWTLNLVCAITGAIMADFLSGVVHWYFDTWGTVNTPVLGVLVRSFREHHIHPRAMCSHDFIEVSADNCIIPIPFVLLCCLWKIQWSWTLEMFLMGSTQWTVVFVLFTNQVHKWAHMSSHQRPLIVKFLQKIGFILQPKHHTHHHLAPFDHNYCIFSGWCNPFLEKIDFWKKFELFITKTTGHLPRNDDLEWTGKSAAAINRLATSADEDSEDELESTKPEPGTTNGAATPKAVLMKQEQRS